MQEQCAQRPADGVGKAGNQSNPGDSAACAAAGEPSQGSKGRIVETHPDADAEHRSGDYEPCDAVRSSEDQQSGGHDQVRDDKQMAPTMPAYRSFRISKTVVRLRDPAISLSKNLSRGLRSEVARYRAEHAGQFPCQREC